MAFFIASLASARVAEVFEGEGGWSIFTSSNVVNPIVSKPYSNLVSLDCLLSFINDEYPDMLECVDPQHRGEMLQFVVLRPSSLGQAASAGSGTTPRDLGGYERSTEATENLDGVSYYFER